MAIKEIISNTRNRLIVKITNTASQVDIDLTDGDTDFGTGVTQTPTGFKVAGINLVKGSGKITIERDIGGGSENTEYVFAGANSVVNWNEDILGTTAANAVLGLSVVPTNADFTMILTLSKVFT